MKIVVIICNVDFSPYFLTATAAATTPATKFTTFAVTTPGKLKSNSNVRVEDL